MRVTSAALLLLLAVVPPVAGSPQAGDDPPRFTVATRKAGDTVEVKADRGAATFAIRSPSGIGGAVVGRTGDGWPKVVVVRLHLTGLESLRLSNGAAEVRAAVGVRDGAVEVRQWKGDRDETPLAADDPLRLAVRVLGRDGKAAARLPVDGGYFEVTPPAAFFKGNPKTLTVDWIDFYR